MDLVQSQKQLNSVIRETHQGLTSKGVDVKRRTIEEVLSPILVSGKSHPVASSHLKSKPKSTQGMVHNLIVNGDNDNVVMMLNQLSESIANASVFNSELSRLGDRFAYDIEAVELSSFSAIQNSKETVDTINKVTQAFRTKDMFDVCHVSIKEIDRQSEHYWFDIELVINKHSIKFVAESISTITLKEYVFNGVDILSGKESSPIAKELISWVKLVSRLFKENNFGGSILFSNRFDLNVSPSLIEMLVESAQKPTFSRKSLVNKESKVSLRTNDDFEKFYLISPEKGLLGSNGSYTSSVDDAALLYESEADDFLSLYPEDGYQKVAFTSCRNVPEKKLHSLLWGWYCNFGSHIFEDKKVDIAEVFDFCSYIGDYCYLPNDSDLTQEDFEKASPQERHKMLSEHALEEDEMLDKAYDILFSEWSGEKVYKKASELNGIHIFKSNGSYLVAVDENEFDDDLDIDSFLTGEF